GIVVLGLGKEHPIRSIGGHGDAVVVGHRAVIAFAALRQWPHAHASKVFAILGPRFTPHAVGHMRSGHEIALVAGINEEIAVEGTLDLGDDVIHDETCDAIRALRTTKLGQHAAIAATAPHFDARLFLEHLLEDHL